MSTNPSPREERRAEMPADDEAMISMSDAYAIAEKIVDMADRVKRLHKVVPGSVAKWSFEIDDTRFDVAINVAVLGEV